MKKNLDAEIWTRFKKGDAQAFSYIFDAYHLQLFEYGQRFTSDRELIRDSIQDLFFELADKREKLSATDHILFYLLKSLRLKIFRNLRKDKRPGYRAEDLQKEEFYLTFSADVDPDEKELKLDLLAEAINQLPPRQKETIYLKFYKNLSNIEVAEIMGVNPQSVSNHIQKAVHRLKTILETDSPSVILFFQRHIC